MIRVLIVDDHAILRAGLRQMFSLTPDIKVAGETDNGRQVLQAVTGGEGFDLLLLDLSLPDISGIELICRVRDQNVKVPILVLSMHNELQIVKRALKAGAAGYLTKNSDPERLFAAIRKVASGGHFIDAAIAEQLVFNGNNNDRPRHEQLSQREFEILGLLAKGLSVNEIAIMLAISNKTVSTYKSRLMEKLALKTTADLVRYAMGIGLGT
jgi:DNA-binding NarL/FixJ family response regulator